jgi:hypothetical protein
MFEKKYSIDKEYLSLICQMHAPFAMKIQRLPITRRVFSTKRPIRCLFAECVMSMHRLPPAHPTRRQSFAMPRRFVVHL